MKLQTALLVLLVCSCGVEEGAFPEATTEEHSSELLAGATELFTVGAADLNTDPKFRIQDTAGVTYPDSAYTVIPGTLNSWKLAQWKKLGQLSPTQTAGAPKTSQYTDPVLGTPNWVYFGGPNAFSPGEESSIATFKRPNATYVYDLRATGGWLDQSGGSNLFLQTTLDTAKTRTLDKPIAFTFGEHLLTASASSSCQSCLTDGTVLGQYFTGFIYDNRNGNNTERTTLFQQVRHANTTTPSSDYANCTLKQSTVNGLPANYYVLIFGYQFNDEPFFTTANATQKPVAYVLNRGVCRMLTRSLTCAVQTCAANYVNCVPKLNPDGSQVTTPLTFTANQKNLGAYVLTSMYHGFETEVAKGSGAIANPITAGLTPKGTVTMHAQVNALSMQRFDAAPTVSCSGGDMVGEVAGLSCTLDGALVTEGTSRTVYDTPSVLHGGSCSAHAQTAKCKNGNFVTSTGQAIAKDLYGTCTVAAATQGFFCAANTSKDTLWACQIDPALNARMTGAGWVSQGNSCYQHGTNNVCSTAQYALCTGNSGDFCNASNTITEYLCGCSAPPSGWVLVPDGCYQRATGVACIP